MGKGGVMMRRRMGRRSLGTLVLLFGLLAGYGPQPVAAQVTFTQITSSTGGYNLRPSINADGSRVAFRSSRDLVPGGNPDGNDEVFLWTAGSGFTQITNTTGGYNYEPSINADGTRIAFYSNRDLVPGGNTDVNFELFLWTQGSGITQITDTTPVWGSNSYPSINADGTRIAFHSFYDLTGGNPDHNGEIFLWTAGSGFTQITNSTGGGNYYPPSINADGTRIAFYSDRDLTGGNGDGNIEIFLWREGSGISQLTDTTGGYNDSPSINADGTRIAFKSTSNLSGSNPDGNEEIFLWSQGSGITQITNTTGSYGNYYPAITADGNRIAFSSTHDLIGGNPDGNTEIFLWTQGSGITQITNTIGWKTADFPSINADGSRIAFVSDHNLTGGNPDGNREIFLATLSPVVADTDGDGMPDAWEITHGLNPNDPSDAALDPDGDGFTNLGEFHAGTNPRDAASHGKNPVLLVHGWCGESNEATWGAMKPLLDANGLNASYADSDYDTNGIGDIRVLAGALGVEIDTVLSDVSKGGRNPDGATKVDIVAHSMGGLATRALMTDMHPSADNDPDARYHNEIRRLIMVGTPNYGAPLAGWDGLNDVCTTTPGPIRDAQAEQMRYGSEFLWSLHNKWSDVVTPDILSRILVVAGTGGPGWNDGVVNVSSAALANGSTEAVRYVPYLHTQIGGIGIVNVPVDLRENHKTFRFILPFLSTGNAPSQADVWADAPNFNEGALLLHVVDEHGPISPSATSSLDLALAPGDWCPDVICQNEHENDTNSTITATGVGADPEQTYTVRVAAHGYLPQDVNDVTIRAARTTVLTDVELQAGADLIVQTLALVSGARVKPGRSIGVELSLKNQGSAYAGPSTTRFVLSPESGGTDTSFGLRLTSGLAAGTTGPSSTVFLDIPRRTPAGCYDLVAMADGTGVVPEVDENNNTKSFPLSVGGQALKITTSRLSSAKMGVPYSRNLTATGGYPPYTWDLAGGSLPPGLSLTADGRIVGTPTTLGVSVFSARVRGAGHCGAEETASKQIMLLVRP